MHILYFLYKYTQIYNISIYYYTLLILFEKGIPLRNSLERAYRLMHAEKYLQDFLYNNILPLYFGKRLKNIRCFYQLYVRLLWLLNCLRSLEN